MIAILGTMNVDPSDRDALLEAAKSLRPETRKKDGCPHHCFTADLDDPAVVHIVEFCLGGVVAPLKALHRMIAPREIHSRHRPRDDTRKRLEAAQPLRLGLRVVRAMNGETEALGWVVEIKAE